VYQRGILVPDNQIDQFREIICNPKYLQADETKREGCSRVADHLKDDQEHYEVCQEILTDDRFLPAGRILASVGSTRITTAFNCFVDGGIEDSMSGIMKSLSEAAETMRLGGGDGFCFSSLRPENALIKGLDSFSSGPISFMEVWDAMCHCIKSAGHRRGAMMATMKVSHPDIEKFIHCKRTAGKLVNFNISVMCDNAFMEAVIRDEEYDLHFDGVVYKTVNAKALWKSIMRSTWDNAEPGVLFYDTINDKNNMWYCETIVATNPCGEQPLPPHGACLLGSFNLIKYVKLANMTDTLSNDKYYYFDFVQLHTDIPPIVRMMDNVIDRTVFPLPEQEAEAKAKRRMGLGITGLANALEVMGLPYGSKEFLFMMEDIMSYIRDDVYMASIELAKEKGPFPAFDRELYNSKSLVIDGLYKNNTAFHNTLPEEIKEEISIHGTRNSHLLSVAPTGTISLYAGNISSGIEPVLANKQTRNAIGADGTTQQFYIEDYAYANYGVEGKTSDLVTAKEHIDVLNLASRYVDSSCSKTANVGDDVTFDEFSELYMQAYLGGASGCTTFRPKAFRKDGDVRGIVIEEYKEPEEDGAACFINEYGERDCAD
jgi:ribonucleoside-diphosphate reductase alpha chain